MSDFLTECWGVDGWTQVGREPQWSRGGKPFSRDPITTSFRRRRDRRSGYGRGNMGSGGLGQTRNQAAPVRSGANGF